MSIKIAEGGLWNKINWHDLREEVQGRSFIEKGVFFDLISYMIDTGNAIPGDTAKVAQLILATEPEEYAALATILKWHFKPGVSKGIEFLYHPATKSAMEDAQAKVLKKRKAARIGGLKTQHQQRQCRDRNRYQK